MGTLRFNDGTEAAGHVLEAGESLYIYIDQGKIAEWYPVLSDPEKAKKIEAIQFGETTKYTKWIHLFCLREEIGGMLSAGLKKR